MQDDALDPGRSFLRLKESLGSLLLCWSRLEGALSDAVRRAAMPSSSPPASFAKRLDMLNSLRSDPGQGVRQSLVDLPDLVRRLDQVRSFRNLIAHHLAGIVADPDKGEPHIVCELGAGARRKHVRITQAELVDLLSAMDRCTRELGHVSTHAAPAHRA